VSSVQRCVAWPESCQVGGNTGTVNSFAGVTLGDISAGLVNAVEDLQDPVTLGCFLAQAVQAETPEFLSNVLSGALLSSALGLVTSLLNPALALLGYCPDLPAGKAVFEPNSVFPGARPQRSGKRNPF
jgi:hypothetical protein